MRVFRLKKIRLSELRCVMLQIQAFRASAQLYRCGRTSFRADKKSASILLNVYQGKGSEVGSVVVANASS
ncbi:hypothetical protein GQ600_22045 [Phytophthora cactorum]|nr:hypothetical protein GQ600_22045 [Phytophthora cactorum]